MTNTYPWLILSIGCLGLGHGISTGDRYSIIAGAAIALFAVHELIFND